jgi:hypothetical protein
MNLMVIHPTCLKRYHGSGGKWVYADHDQEIYERVKRGLGMKAQALMTPVDFQAVVVKLRKEFVSWVDRNLSLDSVEKWVLTPLYKNPFNNNIFLHLCWLSVITMAIKDKSDNMIVVTESHALCQTLRQICQSNSVRFDGIGFLRFALTQIYQNFRTLVGTGLRTLQLVYRILLARIILGEPYKRRLSDIDILVGTFLHDTCLSEEGMFTDKYFPELVNWYARQGMHPASYPAFSQIPLKRLPSLYRRMRCSSTLFIVFELFITLSDFVTSFGRCFREVFLKERVIPFLGMEVGPLVQIPRFRWAIAGWESLLLMMTPKRMSDSGVHPRWVVAWYENQPHDKANTIGFGRLSPPCHVIAVRQYGFIPNFLSLYTTTCEIKAGASPQKNWICGAAQKEAASIYDATGDYRVVPALRYQYLYETNGSFEVRQEKCLSILLTHSRQESIGIVNCLMTVFPYLSTVCEQIRIKPHPDLGAKVIQPIIEQMWPEAKSLFWEEKGLDSLFNISRIVVTAGTSSAVEAVCYGIPVIIIGRVAGLDMNPLEFLDQRLWKVVYDAQGLRKAFESWSPTHPLTLVERLALGREIRRLNFEPVNDVTMRAFMPCSQGVYGTS